MTSLSDFPLKKKRGGKGTTFKQTNKESSQVAKKEREFEILRDHAELLLERTGLKLRVANLEHQAIGYQAVISYLEHQLETKK